MWATGDEVLNVNEAHAYASCSNCVTVAVAFQVVLIMDDARVVVPQNLSVAANYQCYRCITAAIASQLVLSVEDTPGQEQLLALGDVWSRLTQFGQTITSYSVAQISAQLDAFETEIVAILGDASQVPPGPPTPTATGTPAVGSSEPSPTSSSPAPSSTSPSGTAPTDSAPTDTTPTDTTPADPAPTDTTPTDTTPTDTTPADPAPTDPAPPADPTTAPPSPDPTTAAPPPSPSPSP